MAAPPTTNDTKSSFLPLSSSSSFFKDQSTDCAICLGPLYDDNDDDDNNVIELTCGHKWHFECLKQQLEHAQPSKTQRLLFTGCQCAKCGTFCDHPRLRHLTRKTDALREKVDILIAEQLQVDVPELWKTIANSRNKSQQQQQELMNQGRRTYAFYLCSCCEDPYFGGTIECADGVFAGGYQQHQQVPERRLCPACAPQTVCRKPLQHRGQLVWKCRYCCRPSQYVCYGNVHFCAACHERNGHLLREQQKQQQRGTQQNSRASQSMPRLEAIPCPGGNACPFPKPSDQEKHKNGSLPDCEQVYECVCCASAMMQQEQQHQMDQAPGSSNLLVNPNGALGLQGWQPVAVNRGGLRRHRNTYNHGSMALWKVEQSDIPLNDHVRTNFVSSFSWCVMMQRVPLHELVNNPSTVRIEVSAHYMGRTDCPSVFCMEVVVLGEAADGGSGQQPLLHRQATPILEAPADSWERVSLIVEPVTGARELVMVLHGKDSRFWQGNYGSKVTACSVRILGTPDELARLWKNNNRLRAPNQAVGSGRQYDGGDNFDNNRQAEQQALVPQNGTVEGGDGHGRQLNQLQRQLVWDAIISALCIAFFLWLVASH